MSYHWICVSVTEHALSFQPLRCDFVKINWRAITCSITPAVNLAYKCITLDDFLGRADGHSSEVMVHLNCRCAERLIEILEDCEKRIELRIDKHDVATEFQSTDIRDRNIGVYLSVFTSSALPGVCECSIVRESMITRL